MLPELTFGFILWITIFLFVIVIGSELFGIMVDEQTRYLRLIIHYAPVPEKAGIPAGPEPVVRHASWARGEKHHPAASVHIRHSGRIRIGKNGRWMDMGGEAVFSLAVPGFVWRTTITCIPGVWLEAFDYYVDRDAAMNLNLFSVFPLNNAHADEIRDRSLFRYLACTPLFPMVLGSSPFIRWENIDDSAARAILRDKDRSVEGVVRFDGAGRIESVEADRRNHPETGLPLPGHFTCTFTDYSDIDGFFIPLHVKSGIILPEGDEVLAEYTITGIEFSPADAVHGVAS